MVAGNSHLRQAMSEAFDDARDLTGRIHLLGIRADMEALHAASDIVSSTSRTGETYPLCLLEGMACGAVAVATAVGDTPAMLSGGRGGILTPADGYAIAKAWEEALVRRAELRLRDADRARFDRRKMIDAYARVITEAT
jgi:glycosyltransferase involved in cell wall biosynthesis